MSANLDGREWFRQPLINKLRHSEIFFVSFLSPGCDDKLCGASFCFSSSLIDLFNGDATHGCCKCTKLSHGSLVRAVACRTRRDGFNPWSFKLCFHSSGIVGKNCLSKVGRFQLTGIEINLFMAVLPGAITGLNEPCPGQKVAYQFFNFKKLPMALISCGIKNTLKKVLLAPTSSVLSGSKEYIAF